MVAQEIYWKIQAGEFDPNDEVTLTLYQVFTNILILIQTIIFYSLTV